MAEDGDVDGEEVGAFGERVASVACGDGFSEFPERGEHGRELVDGGLEGVAGYVFRGGWGLGRVLGERERTEGCAEGGRGGGM